MSLVTTLVIIALVIIIVIFVAYILNRAALFTPNLNTTVPTPGTGRQIYLISVTGQYLGSSGATFLFFSQPDPRAVWLWIQNVGECHVLDTNVTSCNSGYYNASNKTYNCSQCSGLGSSFCNYCSINDVVPYTSVSIVSNSSDPHYINFTGSTTAAVVNLCSTFTCTGTTLSRVWTQLAQPANSSPLVNGAFSIRIKSAPTTDFGTYVYMVAGLK